MIYIIAPAAKRFLMKMKVLRLVERVSKDSDWKHLVADLIIRDILRMDLRIKYIISICGTPGTMMNCTSVII